MQKSRNRRVASSEQTHNEQEPRQKKYPVAIPDIIDFDALSIMLDEDLNSHIMALEDARDQVSISNLDPQQWEIEVAYARREQQLRRTRKIAHEQYLRALDQESNFDDRDLPVADLDNSRFTELYN